MIRFRPTALALVALTLLIYSLSAPALAKDTALKVRLKKIKLKETFRLGWKVKGEPKAVYEGKIFKRGWLFFDLNGDGRIEPQKDGIGLRKYSFIVPLPRRILLSGGYFEINSSGQELSLSPAESAVPKALLKDAWFYTDIRIRTGVPLFEINEEKSGDCRKHIEYLNTNNVRQGMDMHNETPGRPGYSKEGAKAGHDSCLFPAIKSFHLALVDWVKTPWHGAPMLDPTMKSIGIAMKYNMAMFYPVGRVAMAEDFIYPPPGARNIPRAFSSRGEIPNPVPGTRYAMGCGHPIYIQLDYRNRKRVLEKVEVRAIGSVKKGQFKKKKGAFVRGTKSDPTRPANKSWTSNSALALFVPNRPLKGETRYAVSFHFKGEEKPVSWTFDTEK